MIVKELMTAAVISAPPSMPMVEARSLMAKERIRHLPVIAPGGELLGIVTDRDVRLNLPSQATSLSIWELNHLLSKLTVEEVMTRAVITVGPDRPARDAAQLMVDHQIGALPVEQSGRLVGIVTETDLLRAFIRLETSPRGGPR
ncbi:MAG TPA: CBS domain-containing protein [Verrucomicrobiae bacterium]|jgi:acetoin utilization protein AcuB|nr:CBS domain-containing protein [Verrucomicrobiae bacterium]